MTEPWRLNADFFSPHYGKPMCVQCDERFHDDDHTCRAKCQSCGRPVWGNAALHKDCCPHPEAERAGWDECEVRLARSGQRNYYLRCRVCHANFPQKHAVVPQWVREREPDKDGSDREHPCERCDSHLTEYHHFAPRAIFADADMWPGAWLCKRCHALWHSAMREALGHRLDVERRCEWADDSTRVPPRWVGTSIEHYYRSRA